MVRALFITFITFLLFCGCSLTTPKKFGRKPASFNFSRSCINVMADILLSFDIPIDIERSKRAKQNLEIEYLDLIEKSKKYIGMPRYKSKVRYLKEDLININNKLSYIHEFLANKEQQYRTVPLVESYIGETMGAQDMESQAGKIIRYLTAEEKDMLLVRIDEKGLFRDSKGKLINSEDGLFVMDELGNIYLIDDEAKRFPNEEVTHASFLAGLPVASAGLATIKNGKITVLNDESGHYLPSSAIFQQIITELNTRTADLSELSILLH